MRMQEREKAAAEEAEREKDIALGNPLLNAKADFNVKRRYVCELYLESTRSPVRFCGHGSCHDQTYANKFTQMG